MSALKSAHDLPKEGQSLASIPGSAALGRAKMLLAGVGGICTVLFAILALVLPGAQEDGHDHDHDKEEHAAAPAVAHGEDVLTADNGDAHEGEGEHAEKEVHTNWKGSMAYSWLFAVVFFMTLCVGGIFWTMLHHASNSGWGILVRRLMENLGSVIPLLFALALPLVIFEGPRSALWEWLPKADKIADEAKHHVTDAVVKATMEEKANGVKSAEENLKSVTKEAEAAMASASPNLKYHLEQKVAVAEELVAVAKDEAEDFSDEGDVRDHLIEAHKKHADILLYKKKDYLNKGILVVPLRLLCLCVERNHPAVASLVSSSQDYTRMGILNGFS